MSLKIENLCIVGSSKSWGLWHYRTMDPAGTVLDLDYFDKAGGILRVGDKIETNCTDCSVSLEVLEAEYGNVTVGVWGQLPDSIKRSQAA